MCEARSAGESVSPGCGRPPPRSAPAVGGSARSGSQSHGTGGAEDVEVSVDESGEVAGAPTECARAPPESAAPPRDPLSRPGHRRDRNSQATGVAPRPAGGPRRDEPLRTRPRVRRNSVPFAPKRSVDTPVVGKGGGGDAAQVRPAYPRCRTRRWPHPGCAPGLLGTVTHGDPRP